MAKQPAERQKLGDLMKTLPTHETPVQEVRPVAAKVQGEQVKINGIFAPPDLLRRMKLHSIDTGMKQREIIIAALDAYLGK